MRRNILLCLSLIFLCRAATAQVSGDVFKFDRTVYDFGQVLISDGPVSCSFTATNVSGKDAVIQSVTTSCGCTDVKWDRNAVAPGKSVSIKVTYSNDEGPYPFDKTLTVSVAGSPKPVLLHLRGISAEEIKPDSEVFVYKHCSVFGLSAESFKAPNLEQGSSKGDQTTCVNFSSSPIMVSFTDLTPGLSLEVKPNPIPAKSHATLYYTISSLPQKWGRNKYCATVRIAGEKSSSPIEFVAFTAENFSSLSKQEKAQGSRPVFRQSTFSFGHKKQGEKFTASFTCENAGKAPFAVHKVDLDYKGARVTAPLPQTAPGSSSSLSIEVDTKNLPKGEALVMATLTTNSPLRPIVTLFIAGWID